MRVIYNYTAFLNTNILFCQDYTNSRASTSSSGSSNPEFNDGTSATLTENSDVILEQRLHKIAKSDSKTKSKANKTSNLKDREREKKKERRDFKDEK